ncbi:MAG: ribosomal-processing cysteine protease Prp [Clostridia bacterium]|nr:ribosomal-processing cysteine protease Prp [Clostridia bacterium]
MINVVFYKDNSKGYCGFLAEGHAGFDEYSKDIVCSAVSMLTQTILLGIVEVLNIDANFRVHPGYIKCIIPPLDDENLQQKVNLLLETMYTGLRGIECDYRGYIKICEKEVQYGDED